MLKSMTAFSRVSRDFQWGTLSFELSTVNHRYQEISIRLPRELSSYEAEFNGKLRKAIKRGKIRAKAEMNLGTSMKAVPIDNDVLENYFSQLEEIRKDLRTIEDIRVENLLQLPGVLQSSSLPGTFMDTIAEDLENIAEEAIDALLAMRLQEGKDLQNDILHNLEEYERIENSIETSWETARDSALQNLKQRIQEISEGSGNSIDESRIAQEIAIMADKWDISEEISRTRSHIEKLREVVDSDEAVGRKLDFLLQEMNREINTMASKVSDAEIRWLVVEGKTFLERIREQVQNVE